LITEERCYVLKPTFSPKDYFEIFNAHGRDLQLETLGGLIGYFTTEVGELNAIVSLWEYESFEERQRRRARLAAEPGWQTYLEKIRPMLQTMNNRLLVRAI
tara:strand:+ start:52625 stop:52927 length:303 start_codon:yes stop_codon:yes gene_type:complete